MDQFCHLGLWQKNQRPWTTWAWCQNSMRMIGSVDFKDTSKILFMLFLENYLERRKILNFMPLLANTVTRLCSSFVFSAFFPFFCLFPPDLPSITIWSSILQWIFLTNLNSNLHASSQHRGFQNKNWNRNKFFFSSSWAAFFSLQWVPRIWIPSCWYQDHLVSWWKERQYSVERLRVYRERKCRKRKQKRKNAWELYTENMFLKSSYEREDRQGVFSFRN